MPVLTNGSFPACSTNLVVQRMEGKSTCKSLIEMRKVHSRENIEKTKVIQGDSHRRISVLEILVRNWVVVV